MDNSTADDREPGTAVVRPPGEPVRRNVTPMRVAGRMTS